MPAPSNPNDQGPPESVVLDKFTGLKNTVSRERLGPDELVQAVNVDIDDAGQIARRRGFTQVATGNFHSPFNLQDGRVLVVANGELSVLHPDYSTQSITTIAGSDPSEGEAPLAYAQVAEHVYFSGNGGTGRVDLDTLTAEAWGTDEPFWLSPVVDPTGSLPPVAGRWIVGPPQATALGYYNGRIYMAVGSVLWATDLFTYDWCDRDKGYKQFEAPITMVGVVADGVYVGTEEGLWFLDGPNWDQMKRRRVMDSGVIPGSMVQIPGELGNAPQVPLTFATPLESALMFMTTNGVCLAADAGKTTNLTENKFFFPDAFSAAALYRRQDGANTFIAVTQNGGSPVSNAQIGDYVDATLIRRGTWREVCDRVCVDDQLTAVWS